MPMRSLSSALIGSSGANTDLPGNSLFTKTIKLEALGIAYSGLCLIDFKVLAPFWLLPPFFLATPVTGRFFGAAVATFYCIACMWVFFLHWIVSDYARAESVFYL